MAYNANLYNPYTWGQPSWAAPQQGITQPVNGLVSVTGIEGAKAYQMPPNSSMPLFDADEDILYVKTTDAAGYPTIKAFRFEPTEQAQDEHPGCVPREEFDALCSKVDALISKLTKARNDDGE